MPDDTAAVATAETTEAAAVTGAASTATEAVVATTATEAKPVEAKAPDSGVQDWRSGITDPDALEIARRTQSVADLAKVAADLRKKNGSMINVPGKDAKPEDVAKFHKAIGVPEKAEDYKFDLGRELTDQDKVVTGEIAKVFLANGVPAAAATAVSKVVADLAKAQADEQGRVATEARGAAEAALRKEFGADYDKNLTVALRAVEVFGGDELKAFLNDNVVGGAKLGDHPMLAKAFAKIGLRMGEGDFIGAVTSTEKDSLTAERTRIMNENPPGTAQYRQPHIQKRLAEINTALYGNGPAASGVGRMG